MPLLASLEKLLETVSVEDLTVSRICRAADISRSTFYRQFDGIDHALEALFDSIVVEMVSAAQPWLSGEQSLIKPHLRSVFRAYLNHGPLMRAAADAELGHLTATSTKYRAMMEQWDTLVSARLSASYPWVQDPDTVSHLLNAAGERIMYYDYGSGPTNVTLEQFEKTVNVVYRMWCSYLDLVPETEERERQHD